jgi:V8-like Glu-specific endopeptidase
VTFEYLPPKQEADLLAAAISSDLVDADRKDRMQGIDKMWSASIRRGNNAQDHFIYELRACNEIERLLDGTVPLAQYLANCARWLKFRTLPETTLFATLADRLGNTTSGTPPMAIAVAMPAAIKNEAIIGRNELLDFAFFSKGQLVGQSVGRILVPRFEGGKQCFLADGKPWTMNGTVWMVAKDLAITNHHVINARNSDEAPADAADFEKQACEARLQFDYNAAGVTPTSLQAAKLIAQDPGLDFALLSLSADGPEPLRIAPIRLVLDATSWQPLNIIQHPLGGPKKIGVRSNIARSADNNAIRYFTDTDFGSSGSPVCNDSWQVVALHRGAEHVTGVKFQGQDTAYINLGSQIQAVLDEIRSQNAAIAEEIVQCQSGLASA